MIKISTVLISLLFVCSNVFACREGYDSAWSKPEAFVIKSSKWISVVEIDHVESKLQKNTYFFKVIRNIKGNGPKKSALKLGPFFLEADKSGALIWKDKACQHHVSLEQGKQYILFSEINNPSSIQVSNPENESRISEKLK